MAPWYFGSHESLSSGEDSGQFPKDNGLTCLFLLCREDLPLMGTLLMV